MSDSLSALESRRAELLRAVWRCGKSNCHCAQPDDPGHGPNLRLTYKWHGKTITEALPTPAAVRKAEQEIAEFETLKDRGGGTDFTGSERSAG